MTVSEINPHIRFASGPIRMIPDVYSHAYDSRLIYLGSGRLHFECGDTETDISDGTLLIWPAGLRYRLRALGPVEATILNFDFTQTYAHVPQMPPVGDAEYDPARILERAEFSDCAPLSGLLILPDMHALRDDLARLVGEFSGQNRYFAETASAILKQILLHAARTAAAGGVLTNAAVDRVLAFIRENYARPITNREIAEHVNYHEFYVNKLVQRQTGQTLHRCLLRVRTENAARLLLTTDCPIARIAELTGFSSPAYFASAFRQLTGQSPADFRRSRRNRI